MTVKKLTDADRKEILDLYRHTGETTSTLADRYGVSNSTISRFLKVTLPEEEYETLIAAKRAARTSGGEEKTAPQLNEPEQAPAAALPVVESQVLTETPAEATPGKTVRRRRIAAEISQETETPAKAEVEAGLTSTYIDTQAISSNSEQASLDVPSTRADSFQGAPAAEVSAQANTIAEMLAEDLLDESEDDDDDLDDDIDDIYEDDEDDDDDDDLYEEQPILRRRQPTDTIVQVLPLSEAILPRTCYLVIDRAAELITRPLREFGDLGQIPSQEFQQRTLPVFDNHRVARRFSSKRDRVIKVPDSRMLQKARSHLQAKGITRLLFDGRVYSLSSM
jgi:transposase-like protein